MAAVTEALIEEVVRGFYARVRDNPELGPIFDGAIQEWEPHLLKMMDFWSAVMLSTRRFKGNPVLKHNALGGVTPKHFDTWLGLFRENARELCAPEVADEFIRKAEMIAESLKLAKFGVPGVPRTRSAGGPLYGKTGSRASDPVSARTPPGRREPSCRP